MDNNNYQGNLNPERNWQYANDNQQIQQQNYPNQQYQQSAQFATRNNIQYQQNQSDPNYQHQVTNSFASYQPAPKKKSVVSQWWFWVIIVAVTAIAAISVVLIINNGTSGTIFDNTTKNDVVNSNTTPEALVKSLENSINSRDFDKYISCIHPEYKQDEINSYKQSNYSKKEYMTEVLLGQDPSDYDLDYDGLTCKIDIISVDESGDDYVSIYCRYKVYYEGDNFGENNMTINAVKVKGKWYYEPDSTYYPDGR